VPDIRTRFPQEMIRGMVKRKCSRQAMDRDALLLCDGARPLSLTRPIPVQSGIHLLRHRFDIKRNFQEVGNWST
jgi:hypothetical protein